MKIYKNTEHPKLSEDSEKPTSDAQLSEDVFTYDQEGLMNVAYYDYDEEKWNFHTDTLIDPYENGKLFNFVWLYCPKEMIDLLEQ